MSESTDDQVRTVVRDRYRSAALESQSCCGSTASEASSCCCSGEVSSSRIGYTAAELASLPDGADLSLGCGNPTAIAGIKPGETVLDLGSGAGIDCFLASNRVGPTGTVIGVDMTPEMLTRARENARNGGYTNVDFRLGEIENLPVADASVDLIISNCVVNLSPDKKRVFSEAFRALKPGGRLMISDPVLARPLPEHLLENTALLTGCVAGAMIKHEYLEVIREAGFSTVKIEKETRYAKPDHLESLAKEAGIDPESTATIADTVLSVTVFAQK